MKGLAGKLLRVNLTTGKVENEGIPLQDIMTFIGGRGLAIKYLYDELAPSPLAEIKRVRCPRGISSSTQEASLRLILRSLPVSVLIGLLIIGFRCQQTIIEGFRD